MSTSLGCLAPSRSVPVPFPQGRKEVKGAGHLQSHPTAAAREEEPLQALLKLLCSPVSFDKLLTHSLRDPCISRQERNDKSMTNHSRFRQPVDQRLSSGNAAIPGGGGNNPSLLPKYLVSWALSQAFNPPEIQAVQGAGREKRSLKMSLFDTKG